MTSSFPIINNRYQIFSTIASGGMAVIYLAKDLLLERKVALKILKKDFSDNQEFQNRFRTEAKATASLSHINIITTYDFGFDVDRLYIVMELVDGTDLKTIIKEKSVLCVSEALHYLIQAGNGLGYAHQTGFVHCDIKPQNMLVSTEGVLKITDFGIARALDSISLEERSDVVWGSPYYFSPEQARGLPPSPASDIYSLGIIAYEMFTGELPFMADDASELVRMHKEEKPEPPIKKNPDLPNCINDLILKSISKDPAYRYPNGNAFTDELLSLNIPHEIPGASLLKNKIGQKKKETQQEKPIKHQNKIVSTERTLKFNWVTILLSFLALILAGGLIPFWIYVLFSISK